VSTALGRGKKGAGRIGVDGDGKPRENRKKANRKVKILNKMVAQCVKFGIMMTMQTITSQQMTRASVQIQGDTTSAGFENRLMEEMDSLKVGGTRVIHGVVVTRWSQETFEVGTFNRASQPFNSAVDMILRSLAS
jgi:hypothetical protein